MSARPRVELAATLTLALLMAPAAARAVAATPAEELFGQAERLLAAGQTEAAVARLKEALAADPRHWQSLCRMGEIQAAARQYAEAEASLKAALEVKPDSGACHARLAQVLLVGERLADAERHLVRATELLPGDEGTLFNLARLYDTTGRAGAAIETFRKYLAVATDGRRTSTAQIRLGRLLVQERRANEAVEVYRGFLAGQPERHEVRPELAAALMSASRYDEALAEYDRMFAAGLEDPESLANAGSIRLLNKDFAGAVDLLARSLKGRPADVTTRLSYATALAQLGRHDQAVEVLTAVTKDEPENIRVWFLLGQSLMKLGRTDEGRRAIERHREIHEKEMKRRGMGETAP